MAQVAADLSCLLELSNEPNYSSLRQLKYSGPRSYSLVKKLILASVCYINQPSLNIFLKFMKVSNQVRTSYYLALPTYDI